MSEDDEDSAGSSKGKLGQSVLCYKRMCCLGSPVRKTASLYSCIYNVD